MKKTIGLVMMGLLLLAPCGAGARAAEALEYGALEAFAQALLDSLSQYTIQNDPADTYDPSGDGAYLYDYGAVRLTMTDTQAAIFNVRQIEIVDPAVAGPGGVRVGDTLEDVLAAFACHNPSLRGDESFAALYANELTESDGRTEYDWAWVMRGGETVYGVQYACSREMKDGRYADAGVLYIFNDARVSSIRLYGFSQRITAQEAEMNFDTARDMQGRDTYASPLLSQAHALDALAQAELTVNGVSLLGKKREDVRQALGEAEAVDERTDEGGETVYALRYPDMEVTLNAQETVMQVSLTHAGAAGPRGLCVGMTDRQALSLLRVDAPVYSGQNAALYLEGEAGDDPPYAYMDFFDGGRSAIRVGVRIDERTALAALVYIDIGQGVVEEIRLTLFEV